MVEVEAEVEEPDVVREAEGLRLHLSSKSNTGYMGVRKQRGRYEARVKKSERLDTFRRKFKNFELGDLGSSAERRLHAMRLRCASLLLGLLCALIGLFCNVNRSLLRINRPLFRIIRPLCTLMHTAARDAPQVC